jgi:glycosyltransferase involved in cell wall biosynthesis
MRILYLHQYFNNNRMAGSTRSFEMARRMALKGHRVTILTSDKTSPNSGEWSVTQEEGLEVHWLSNKYSNHMEYNERIRSFLRFAFYTAFRGVKLKADVVFASSTPLTIAIPGVLISRWLKVPMVFEVRDLWPEMPIALGALRNPISQVLGRSLEKWAYRNAASIVALSPQMKNGIAAKGYPRKNIAVIPNGSDMRYFSEVEAADPNIIECIPDTNEAPLLLYAGTFGKVNGLEYLVYTADELAKINSSVKILLVGDGSERAQIIQLAEKLGVLNINLFVQSSFEKRVMPALFAASSMSANIVIDVPEATANSANKFFDTLAAGRPVLLNHGGWMEQIVNYYGCGLALPDTPVSEVAALLDRHLHDQEWLDRAGNAAREIGLRYFCRDKLANQLERVLLATVQGTPNQSEQIANGEYI